MSEWLCDKIADITTKDTSYILIIAECDKAGRIVKSEAKLAGTPIILNGLLSVIEKSLDMIDDKIYDKIQDGAVNPETNEKVMELQKLLSEIEDINSEESEKLMDEIFPANGILKVAEENLDEYIKKATDLLATLNKDRKKDDSVDFMKS